MRAIYSIIINTFFKKDMLFRQKLPIQVTIFVGRWL